MALPRVTGGTVVCNVPPASGLSLFTPQHNPAAPCNIVQILWGIGFLTLMLSTAVMAYTSYRVLRRAERLQAWTLEERREAIGYFTQLMLVLSPLLILFVYATTSSAGLDPWYSARYLTSTLIALPAVLWPIWRVGTDLKSKRLASSIKVLSPLLLLVIFLFFTVGWVQTLNLIPAAQDAKRQEADLIQALLNRGITHIYTDYWTCDRIAFESTERIICSVVDEQLQARSESLHTLYNYYQRRISCILGIPCWITTGPRIRAKHAKVGRVQPVIHTRWLRYLYAHHASYGWPIQVRDCSSLFCRPQMSTSIHFKLKLKTN